jgi:hypothetical protein
MKKRNKLKKKRSLELGTSRIRYQMRSSLQLTPVGHTYNPSYLGG